MNEILKLLEIVLERNKKVIPLLDFQQPSTEDNKEHQLYELIQQLEEPTDEAAAQAMYNADADDPRYKMLKHRLRNRLLNHLFFIDFKDDFSPISYQHEQEALNYYYYIQTLLKKNEEKLAEKLLNKNISFCETAELTAFHIMCLEQYMYLYSRQQKINHYNEIAEKFNEMTTLRSKEDEAQLLFLSNQIKFEKSANSRKKNMEATVKALDRLQVLFQETKSYNVFSYYYQLKVLYLEHEGDFDALLKFVRKVNEEYSEEKINKMRFSIDQNRLKEIKALFKAQHFKEGLNFCEFYSGTFHKSTLSYFEYMQWYFLLAMFTANYPKAYEIIRELNKNPYYPGLPEEHRMMWELYRAYLFYAKPDKRLLKSFNYDFFYETPVEFSKKQKGEEIAVLVLRYLTLLEQNKTDDLLPLVDRFRQFSTLQLYEQENKRTRLFLKFLILAFEKEFDYASCASRSEVPLSKLRSAPLPGDGSMEIEIIPYDQLWEQTLEIIRKRSEEPISMTT
jgi:hypothetical protein